MDLYDSSTLSGKSDQFVRLFMVLGLLALSLSGVVAVYNHFLPGHEFLPHESALVGFVILTFGLLGWRGAFSWLTQRHYFRERVYVLGTGERAQRLLDGLRQRSELGIEVVGWTGQIAAENDGAHTELEGTAKTGNPVRDRFERELMADIQTPGVEAKVGILQKNVQFELTRDAVASHLLGLVRGRGVHRVIVAMQDRRGTLPVDELLRLRLDGVRVEEATSWLEKIYGRIEVENLNPSWLIFADGFRFNSLFRLVRRSLSFSVALLGLVVALPVLPCIMLAVKLGSPGPILYKQRRVGRGGSTFTCYKFRTMRQDAEADTGATWAADDDPRITRVGMFLRKCRLDEIPQLWCVLKGDMHFVGPRPERPEFVEWLSQEIPYYGVRHMVRPGITGWAQVQYKYGNTREDAREKLQYDLFYIKNASVGLDFLIMFQTIKIVLLGRGAR
jgi:exopolysaccharide biosynthesis polyprenyl glycosylphosphotransferase